MAKTRGPKRAKTGAPMAGQGVFRPPGGGLAGAKWAGFGCLGRMTFACALAGICGGGGIQQPCHPHAGMCGGMGSMAAAYHCHPSYYENPTLHIGV